MDRSVHALFVGYESQENLGLRHIMSFLASKGFASRLVAFRDGVPEDVVAVANQCRPALIGFSVLFQYTISAFAAVMRLLREAGITAHFTAGGHFPTLRPEATFTELPELDSIVRFEGEVTTLELLERLAEPKHWHAVPGLAFRRDGDIVLNEPRPLIEDLDALPWPMRPRSPTVVRGVAAAPLLASRGCSYDCAFCSIRRFYGGAPGRLRRVRSPQNVVAEMRHLHEKSAVRVFVFHDDDFATKTPRNRAWISSFLDCLDAAKLTGNIVWKISCRADDVEGQVLSRCCSHGLISVYVGVESGHAAGLATLNKRTTVEQNLAALRTLKELGLGYDMGFMLFDPDTTLEGFQANLRFLREVAQLGGLPISFAKAMPLAGTALEQRLLESGRLFGTDARPDYSLLDPRMDVLALFITLHFSFRNSHPRGLVERFRAAAFDLALARAFESGSWVSEYQEAIDNVVARANSVALDSLDALGKVMAPLPDTLESAASNWPRLVQIIRREHQVEAQVADDLDELVRRYSPGLDQAFREQDAESLDSLYVYT